MNPALVRQGEERRTKILGYIREYVGDKGYAPNIVEIAQAVDLGSPNGVRFHLQTLQKEGFLTVQPRVARAITLASPAPDGWSR